MGKAASTARGATASNSARPFRCRPLPVSGATLAAPDRLQGAAAYPAAYTPQGRQAAHGPNIRSAVLRTVAGLRFCTCV